MVLLSFARTSLCDKITDRSPWCEFLTICYGSSQRADNNFLTDETANFCSETMVTLTLRMMMDLGDSIVHF